MRRGRGYDTIRPVIRRSSEPNPPEQFQQWLNRVARPIEFATRDAFAHLPTVKNLNRFVSSQVMQVLSDRVYPRTIEAALLQLRELFLEDQQRLPAEDQQRRLQEAAVILEVLRKAARDSARAWSVCSCAERSSPAFAQNQRGMPRLTPKTVSFFRRKRSCS